MNWRFNICLISFIFLFLSSLIMLFLGIYFSLFEMKIFIEWEILSLNSMNVVMTLLLDWMSLIFMGFVLFISSMVIFYSNNYMEGDPYISRFILLVLMFVFSMMLLIISPNMISILLGWDGLGLISYLLVIYYQNFKSYSAGMLTVLSNRLGDVAFLLSIAWMLNYGSWNYIYYLNYMFSDFEGLMISLLMMFAAMTKSAQIPFSSWLPAAMAAPTPVSSLVHSSTLVTAGVYLMIRFNSLLMLTGLAKYLLLVGGMTMFMSGLGANYEFDLKKIIALSTLSQLGLMMSILSMGYPDLAFFHLLTHALFKALLFMCAGVIIHNLSDCQDIRYMGGLVMFFPLTASCFMISNLALCGFPFLAGFYSKDLILEMCLMSDLNCLSFIFYFFSTGLTACYTFRLVYYVMSSSFNYMSCNGMSDEGWDMLKSMVFMVMMAVVGGAILSWVLFHVPSMICLPVLGKMLALIVTLLGALFGYQVSILYYTSKLSSMNMIFMSSFLGSMWFMPYISTSGVYIYPLSVGDYIVKGFDKGWCEYFGAQGFYSMFKTLTVLIQCYQNNFLKVYLMLFFTFLLVLLILF
uniref:NADH-ubiquinone oxidoreductase chain 5 n=1 Tax=Brachythemis contaminata TaxID=342759 RepID=A0A0U1YT11_BRACT|nr:NADH dehydrogenase subunit 5 [Brachythemis contaminata]AJE75783.1 NADH dehydrogenase subunit 5 [Brachythemis contaminata]